MMNRLLHKKNFKFFFRKKKYNTENLSQTNLSRVLGLFDITALGTVYFR
jgi:hypothetical protein